MSAQTIYSTIEPTVLIVRKHNKTGKLYFHKTTRLDKIETYLGSGTYWSNHLKKHGNDVSTLWISEIFEDESIKDFALKFSEDHDIVKSDVWANQVPETGLGGGTDTSCFIDYDELHSKRNQTINDPLWKETTGKIRAQRQSKSIKQTINDPLWKETTGKTQIEKIKAHYDDPVWVETVLKEQIEKTKKIKSDLEWLETVGKDAFSRIGKKATERQLDPIWRNKNYKTCEHCGKTVDPGNFARYHGKNCKKSTLNSITK